MATPEEYGPPRNDDERQALGRILSDCFGRPPDSPITIEADDPIKDPRVLRVNGAVAGGLWFIPMGQWFGGRSVPMHGIAAVGTDPAYRGHGVALRLMTAAMRELHEGGVALSGLYPATQTLYRKAGFELAGTRHHIRIEPQRIPIRDHDASMREITDADRETVAAVHRDYARRYSGHLDRAEYIWRRVREWREEPARGFLIEEAGNPTGYVYKIHRRLPEGTYEVQLTDVAVLTPGAARRAWTFLADHGSIVPGVEWHGSPQDPLVTLLPEFAMKMTLNMMWMTRIVDVARALEGRGYAPGVTERLEIAVEDDGVPGNRGNHVLEVTDGEGRVTPGGSGEIVVDVRGLAALYTGFQPAENLVIQGLLRGPRASLARAASVFAGPAPWMPDMF